MRQGIRGLVMLVGLLWVGDEARAQGRRIETLPPPRPVPSVEVWPAPAPLHPPYYRVNPYFRWQYYSIDRFGRFRPLVVYQPGYGAYYLYSGRPYPWVTTNSENVRSTILGTPYR